MIAADLLRTAPTRPAHPWPRRELTPAGWRTLAGALAASPNVDLLAMWADATMVHALFCNSAVPEILPASVPVADGLYPALSPARPVAAWWERMIHDLWGYRAEGGTDTRPWLDHGLWDRLHPLAPYQGDVPLPPQPAEFLPPPGADLHQMVIGPVQAGIATAGHLRLTCAGETIVRAECRHGHTHKGTLALLRGKSPRNAARFAARLSGDATVAHAIAFARAAEAASIIEPPPRAHALRAVMAELERAANHCNDIASIIAAADFPPLAARLSWHREQIRRAAAISFGHRLMMDCVMPGGVAVDIAPAGPATILEALDRLADEWPHLLRSFDHSAGLADRIEGIGVTDAGWVALCAAPGHVGRAAGRSLDARRAPGYPPYPGLLSEPPTRREGDVRARLRLCLAELAAAPALLRRLLSDLPEGTISEPLPAASGEGYGCAESFRGDCWAWLRLDGGMIAAAFLADPSWRLWPVLEQALAGAALADFPLISRSINASTSGVDL